MSYGASVRSRNILGWSPVDEAVSYGDQEIGMTDFFKILVILIFRVLKYSVAFPEVWLTQYSRSWTYTNANSSQPSWCKLLSAEKN